MRRHRAAYALLLELCALLSAAEASGQDSASNPHGATHAAGMSMVRIASATAWQPDATPMHSLETTLGAWSFMVHGNASLGYAYAEGRKGGSRVSLSNWGMAHASRLLRRGALTLTVMGSLETLTMGECGTPGLLATVSTCSTNAVRDFQHPHPPLMELAGRFDLRLAGSLHLELYGALVGEPALGPPHYLHRVFAAADPTAPISAHESNLAHASGGVVTAGLHASSWKIEGSIFNPSSADADRILPDFGRLEAVAGRISLNPSPRWSLQASAGRLPGAAGHHVGATGTIRTLTASALHQRLLDTGGDWATGLIVSRMDDGNLARNSALLESSLSVSGTHTWFGRVEIAHRNDSRVTIIEHPDGTHEHLVDNHRVTVSQIAAGYLLTRPLAGAVVGIAVRGAISFLPDELEPIYQSRRPSSFSVYASIRPRGASTTHHP